MNRSTKGAVAAAAAAVLLLGGAGSLAYWTETVSLPGTAIESGHLEIINDDCGTAIWTLDGEVAAFNPLTDLIVPGDVLTKTCSFEIDGEGTHFTDVAFAAGTPAWAATNALTGAMTIDDSYQVGGVDVAGDVVVGAVVDATISLTFNTATTGDVAEDANAVLNAVTITATQNHN